MTKFKDHGFKTLIGLFKGTSKSKRDSKIKEIAL